MKYKCNDGDRLDTICQRHYGSVVGTVEAVLVANPGLAERVNPVYNSGDVIILPKINKPAQQVTKKVSLWD